MSPRKSLTAFSASLLVVLSMATPAHAAISAYFSAGTTCSGPASANFTPGGEAINVSLCVASTAETLCGFTVKLQAARAAENGCFAVGSPPVWGEEFSPAAYDNSIMPLSNPPVMRFGANAQTATGLPVPVANRLLATFEIWPQRIATNSSYLISLSAISMVSVATGGECGSPTDAEISATFRLNRN